VSLKVGALHATLDLDKKPFSRGLSSAESEAKSSGSRIGSSLAGAGAAILKWGAATIGAIGVGIGVLGTNTLANLETATLQFGTLMGSADRARKHVQGLFEFAKRTPFETGPIIQASRIMQTFGGDALNTKENLQLFGDAAAATNAPIEDIAFWMSRAYAAIQGGQPFGEARMRLMELGVITPQVAGEIEALEKRGASSSEVWKTLSGELDGYTGAMEDQAGTWKGLTSTFSDVISTLSATVFAPFFEDMKEGLAGVNDWLGSDGVQATVEAFGEVANEAIGSVVDFVRDSWPAVQEGIVGTFEKIQEIAEGLWPVLEPVLQVLGDIAAVAWQGTVDTLATLFDTITDMAGAVGDWARENNELLDSVTAITSSVIIEGLRGLFEALQYLGSNPVILGIGALAGALWGVNAVLDVIHRHPIIAGISAIIIAFGLLETASNHLRDEMKSDSDSIGYTIASLHLLILEQIANIVGGLATLLDAFAQMRFGIEIIAMNVVASVATMAADIVGALALLDPSLAGVEQGLRDMAETARDKASAAQTSLSNFGTSNPLRQLETDIRGNRDQLKTYLDQMQTDAAKQERKNAWAAAAAGIAAAWGTSMINTISSYRPGISSVMAVPGGGNAQRPRAYASGGLIASTQLALVGERGPELVALPAGATVFSHSRSREMAGRIAGEQRGGNTFHVYGADPDEVTRAVMRADRRRAIEWGLG
jgi:hypothetical protein